MYILPNYQTTFIPQRHSTNEVPNKRSPSSPPLHHSTPSCHEIATNTIIFDEMTSTCNLSKTSSPAYRLNDVFSADKASHTAMCLAQRCSS